MHTRLLLLLLALALPWVLPAQTVDPRATFYRLDAGDVGAAPTFLDLTGYADGSVLYLFPRGRFTVGPGGTGFLMDARATTLPYGYAAAFTSDTWVGASNQLQRLNVVPGGQPALTVGPSLFEGANRNIAHDFRVSGDVFPFVKPVGANYLAIGLIDDAYWDNGTLAPQAMRVWLSTSDAVDPDPGNCAAMIAYNLPCTAGNGPWIGPGGPPGGFPPVVIPEPATLVLVGLGFGVTGALHAWRRRRAA